VAHFRENRWPVTFTIGAVTFLGVADSVDDLLKKADAAMYAAKRSGKNRIKLEVVGEPAADFETLRAPETTRKPAKIV